MRTGEATRPAIGAWVSAAALLAVALLMVVPTGVAARSPGNVPSVSAGASIGPAQEPYTVTTINYTSSVDGFPLSYSEILPLNYSSTETYPLAIELHGISTSEGTPRAGGYPTPVTNTTAEAAVAAGFIEIVINTRTGDGFYVDSSFDGPQGQDVLDAIAHEQALRHIGKLYIFGFSMGSMGAISLGLNHPGLFAGVGAVAAFSDDFELEGRLVFTGNDVLQDAGLAPTGGLWPNASTYAQGIFEELSPLRFHPTNASGLRMWFAGGGLDVFATNNLTFWPYEQANDTVLDSSCLSETDLGEPANCTVPLAALHAEDPANYSYRYIFEPNGFHDYALLNATDMFAFFNGAVPSGEFWGYFPDPTPLPQPVPLVTLVTEPAGCGGIAINGTWYPSMESIPILPAEVPVAFLPCPGEVVGTVTASGGVAYDPISGNLRVLDSGALVVVYTAPSYQVSFVTDSICDTVLFGGTVVTANSTHAFPPGVYLASAEPCAGFTFSTWTTAGGVTASNSTAVTTPINVTGNGTLMVTYTRNPGSHPVVSVTLTSAPTTCAPLMFGAASVAAGTVLQVPTGTYNISAPACDQQLFVAWSASGGIVLGGPAAATTANVTSGGTLTAVYAPLGTASQSTLSVSVTPAGCGAIVGISGVFYANGSVVLLEPGTYSVTPGTCPGYSFESWSATGGASVSVGTLTVQGNGSLRATFTSNSGSGGGLTGSDAGSSVTGEVEWLIGGAVLGAIGGVGVALVIQRSRTRSAP